MSSSSAPGWQDADLLRMANAEWPTIAKRIRMTKTGHFNVSKDYAFVVGTRVYRNNTRAMHGAVTLVQLVQPDGTVQHLDKWVESDLAGLNPTTAGTPKAYLWRNNSLVFYPTPDSASYSYRLTYPRRPSQLVAATAAGLVLGGIGTPPTTLTLQDYTYTTLGITTSTPVDVLQSEPPFDAVADDITPTATAASYALSFASGDLPQEVSAAAYGGTGKRYYVALAGQSPVLQMPTEAFYVLAHRVALKMVPMGGEIWNDLTRELGPLEMDLYEGFADRDPGEPDHVANTIWP